MNRPFDNGLDTYKSTVVSPLSPPGAKIPGGCILVARKMLDSDFMNLSPLVVKLFLWLLLKANWKARGQLQRGQLVTTIAEMQEATSYYSGWRKIKPTPDQIRSAYGTLRDTARITARRTTRGMVITVLNFDTYQDITAYASRTDSRDGAATEPATTPHDTEERETGKKEKRKPLKPYGDFADFWCAYPRKVNKGAAEKAWIKLAPPEELHAEILQALEWQSQQPDWQKDGGKFIPHPATWLNGERWEDQKPGTSNSGMTAPHKGIIPPNPPDTDWLGGSSFDFGA